MAILISLSGAIQAQDVVTNNLILNKTLATLQFTGSVSTVGESISVSTSPVSISLPVSPTQVVYVKNTHATQTLLVTWTPNGGSTNPVVTLQPQGFILFGEPNITSGITALSVTGSGAGTTLEYFVCG